MFWGKCIYKEKHNFSLSKETWESPPSFNSLFLHVHTPRKERPDKDTVRRWLTANQEYTLHQKPIMLAPWSQTCNLQVHEKMNFYCLSQQVYDILLWKPKQTKRVRHAIEPKCFFKFWIGLWAGYLLFAPVDSLSTILPPPVMLIWILHLFSISKTDDMIINI